MKAWRCWCPRLGGSPDGENCGLYRAETRSRAKYLSWLNASEAFDGITLMDIRARRAFDHDTSEFREGVMPRYAEPSSERTGKRGRL